MKRMGIGHLRLCILFIFAIVTVASTNFAAAQADVCQPEGMSDAEAARIIEIATEQGRSFRNAIDDMRASGISYETDTTYSDLMADPERAIALARERHFGRNRSLYSRTPERLLELGTTLDELFESRLQYWVRKANVNFFTTELTNHLQQLAVQLGGESTDSRYRYKINARTFVFAIAHFTKGAELRYIWGSSSNRVEYLLTQHKFYEEWAFSEGRKPNFNVLIFLTSNPEGENITLDGISFGRADTLKNGWPIFEPTNEGCLATFTQVEE